MKTRALLFGLFALTLFAIATLLSLLLNYSPSATETIGLFYVAVFLTTFGLTFFALYGFFYFRAQMIPSWKQTVTAFRIGSLTGLLLVAYLLLSHNNSLNSATVIVLLVGMIIVEISLRKRTLVKS